MFRRLLILSLLLAISTCSLLAKNDSVVMQKKHEPKKATLYSAVLPGLGQAYTSGVKGQSVMGVTLCDLGAKKPTLYSPSTRAIGY